MKLKRIAENIAEKKLKIGDRVLYKKSSYTLYGKIVGFASRLVLIGVGDTDNPSEYWVERWHYSNFKRVD